MMNLYAYFMRRDHCRSDGSEKMAMKYSWRRNLISFAAGICLLLITVLPASASSIPTISILQVAVDQTVTLRTSNFPANELFTIRMGEMGTRAENGVIIQTIQSGAGGVMDITCVIPDELKGRAQIAIRLESANGFYAYNWFYNNTGSIVASPSTISLSTYNGIPTIDVLRVDNDGSVTLMGINFPAYQMFTVRMGLNGTKGINGKVVAVTDTGLGGAFEVTYQVPEDLFTQSKVAIRLENENGFYSYNWFYTPAAQNVPVVLENPGYSAVFPTMSISSVVKDQSVTFQVYNLPAGENCTVYMGYMGTKGANGVAAGSILSATSEIVDATITIPQEMAGQGQIAIRVVSASGYYAYNWFYNTSTY